MRDLLELPESPDLTLRALASALLLPATILAVGVAGSGCQEDGVLLPDGYNTIKFRQITIRPNEEHAAPYDKVYPLNGMQGAPEAIVHGDDDLRLAYWGRPKQSTEPDGAHVGMIRVGTDTLCDISLESVFPTEGADRDNPQSYSFGKLDAHMSAIADLNVAQILWQPAFHPEGGGTCEAEAGVQLGHPIPTISDGNLWKDVVINTLRHLVDGKQGWDSQSGKTFNVRYVEFLDDPFERMGYSEADSQSLDDLYLYFQSMAGGIKARWKDDATTGAPQIRVGGISWTFTSPQELGALHETPDDQKHPLLDFIDYCIDHDVPLDFVSFKTRTVHPFDAACIASGLREYLDTHPYDATDRLQDTQLIATSVEFERDTEEPVLRAMLGLDPGATPDPELESIYLGAFQAAARIFMQTPLSTACPYEPRGPVRWMISGRGVRVYSDLEPHGGENPDNLTGLIVDSPYFEPNGTALPAFMSLFPFRQVDGQQKVNVTDGNEPQGIAVLASHDPDSNRILHVIAANPNVLGGNADVTYDLRIENWASPTIPVIETKFAVLDRSAVGVGSFHFSETGIVEPIDQTGAVRFVHQMAVPSIHYIQFIKPKACSSVADCDKDYCCVEGRCLRPEHTAEACAAKE